MNLKELETQLHSFIAGRRHDPAEDALTTRATAVEAQAQSVEARRVKTQQALADGTLLAEEAYARGDKIDTAARQRLRMAALEAEDDARLITRALERIRQDVTKVRATRADRDVDVLTPIFSDLISLADERAESLMQIVDLLLLAHDTANSVLPGASSGLQQGYAALLTHERLEWWRQRAEVAGLLKVDRQRVA